MKSLTFAIVPIVLAFLILLHQYVSFGVWWDMKQFLHHENIAATLAAVGFGMLIDNKLKSMKKG